ncbi:MAG: hypothetical protein M1829_002989 [Trizodia sp. TS-e1964]|nr:MAG: hypothetical protein M1829_002989 [Trizodia sp. TS-e1964]
MLQERLNDAAIALSRALNAANIKYGIFGGHAISALGGPRVSKDLDCIASLGKEDAIRILDQSFGFRYVDQSREDYVAFLWSDLPGNENPVLVEIFPVVFPGSKFSMDNIGLTQIQVSGKSFGQEPAAILDPLFLFKGKMRAAASRDKFHDSADL